MKLLFGVDPVNWVNTEEQLHKYVPLEKALRCFDSNALDILEKMLPLMATWLRIDSTQNANQELAHNNYLLNIVVDNTKREENMTTGWEIGALLVAIILFFLYLIYKFLSDEEDFDGFA